MYIIKMVLFGASDLAEDGWLNVWFGRCLYEPHVEECTDLE